jgi:hypothetical protein
MHLGTKPLVERLFSFTPGSKQSLGGQMITAAQCLEMAHRYRTLSQTSGISKDRAFIMKNIARSFTGLAGQLDRLDALTRDEQPT